MKKLGVKTDVMLRPEDLQSIEKKVYEVREEELTARTLVSIKSDDPPGAETIGWDIITKKGAAKIFAYGADDVPLVDADMTRHYQRVFGIVLGFRMDVQEKRAAAMAGRPVDTTKAAATRRGIAEKENSFFFIGDAAYNAKGLVNFTGIQTYAAPADGTGTSSHWHDKTGDLICRDLRVARKKVNILPGLRVDTLALPPDEFEELDKPYNSTGTNPELTIRKFLEGQNWFSRIVSSPELTGAGDAASDCALVFDSNEEVVQLSVPMELVVHPPVPLANLSEQVNCEERTGGAVVRFPLGICRIDGIG